MSGFPPGVVDMLDEKHVDISQPIEDAAAYRNRHHRYSVSVRALCDDNLMVRDLNVGEAFATHESSNEAFYVVQYSSSQTF